MACATMQTMKSLPMDERAALGQVLRDRYDTKPSEGSVGQLTVNEAAVVGIEHRLLRVCWFVELLKPDIITFQELDNFSFLKQELEKLGYACGPPGAAEYVPFKSRGDNGDYLE